MDQNNGLEFIKNMMQHLHLPVYETGGDDLELTDLDMGLRRDLGITVESVTQWGAHLKPIVREKVIYYVTDEFRCRYALMLLPGGAGKVLLLGPYVTENVDRQWIAAFVGTFRIDPEKMHILERFYSRVCYLPSERTLHAALYTLGEKIWGSVSSERINRGLPESWTPLADNTAPEGVPDTIQVLEDRYASENRMMELVSKGQVQKLKMMLSGIPRVVMDQRQEPVRDVRNYTVILNTLMRKAAERSGVHPLYIDRVSSRFAREIEMLSTWDAVMALWQEMATQYCLLVKEHTVGQYSPLVQKVILRIDYDLAADLSLRTTAAQLNVSPNYLSTLFHQEMGTNMTDYVNRRRMERAAYLLTHTDMTVSAVAQTCGIQDDNYFTKLFKKYNGKTPKAFRKEQGVGGKG